MKIGYLGPQGSYSQIAALAFKGDNICLPYPSFYALFKALRLGQTDSIVLPIENTLNGGVMQNLDLLQDAEAALAVEETRVKIDHRLVTLKGADKSKINRIYSHAQALGQCAKYLEEHFPNAKQIQTPSTSGCLEMIKSESDAGIIGSHCSADGFEISEECISDEQINYTQFLRVEKLSAMPERRSAKIYFSVTCKHEPGALMRLLSVFANRSLNMTKIESRPIKERVGEYRFFIELEADYASANVKRALEEIKNYTNSFKLLGCY